MTRLERIRKSLEDVKNQLLSCVDADQIKSLKEQIKTLEQDEAQTLKVLNTAQNRLLTAKN